MDKRLNRFTSNKGDVATYTVIGVVENFHFESLRDSIGPLVMFLKENNDLVSFRIDPKNIPGTIDLLKEKWNKFLPNQPFAYSFLDERFSKVYSAEQRIGKIFAVFAGLAVLIGCLGLFGLSAFIAERRTKEIGIRKVLGASASGIVSLLSREFVILVGAANIIAWPIVYFVMNKWLEEFAYKTSLSIWIFVFAGIFVFLVALLTVGYQAAKAALGNPIKAIRNE